MKKLLIATAIAAGVILASPVAAFAQDANYPAGDVPETAAEPGGTVSFSIQTGQPTTPGTVTVEGDEVDPSAITSAAVSHNLVTGADGLAKFGVIIPENATPGASYLVKLAVGAFNYETSLDVADAQLDTSAQSGSDDETESSPVPLASGADSGAPTAVWFGAGAAALVAAVVAVFAVRRSRKAKAAE